MKTIRSRKFQVWLGLWLGIAFACGVNLVICPRICPLGIEKELLLLSWVLLPVSVMVAILPPGTRGERVFVCAMSAVVAIAALGVVEWCGWPSAVPSLTGFVGGGVGGRPSAVPSPYSVLQSESVHNLLITLFALDFYLGPVLLLFLALFGSPLFDRKGERGWQLFYYSERRKENKEENKREET